jgi:hypothetical protein
MAREGENANQPFDPAIERAVAEAGGARTVRVDYSMDADTRRATLTGQVERFVTDLTPPAPVALSIPFAHVKIMAGGILVAEAEEHRALGQMGAAAIKLQVGRKLTQEGEDEQRALARQEEAERHARAKGRGNGSEGSTGAPGASTGDSGVPGVDY